ncbi:hypothetical protein wVul_0626 [Wolbachia endosymbiont of Armadillidium vulgare str. wVulC]|uniref:Uncharacterized protein n=1 Tax=Wolbachia endosymbiont of Armadillidium arcangelii TaxID=3158571 RepID=A0AAU7Q309_9RICK|nr:hypothetical protein [Wolbachia endosymbiont of Armadillidium vulgare]KLT23423.1 hypothetical protein wVul_0626 [Wolbachia endosymbiont of Armadillidium vulgare str. wVulC]
MHATIGFPLEVSIRDLIMNILRSSTSSAVGRYKQSTTSLNGLKVTEEVKLSDDFIDVLMGREVQISRNAVIAKCSRIITRANGEEISEEKEIKSQGFVTELKEKIRISGRESIAEWAADWLIEGFKQQLLPLSDLEDVTVATSQQSRQQ